MAEGPLFIVESEDKAKMLEQLAGAGAISALIKTPPVTVEAIRPPDESAGSKGGGESYSFALSPEEQHLAALLAQRTDRPVYIAMDGDSRGKYWAWLLQNYIRDHHPDISCRSIVLQGLSPVEYSASLAASEKNEAVSAESTYIRSFFFDCLGVHLQRLIGTQFGPHKLPLNFNSLTTLFLLKNREDENKMYAAVQRWHVAALPKLAGRELWAECRGHAGRPKTDLESEENCRALEKQLMASGLSVTGIERKNFSLPAPPPYPLAELLQAAHADLHMSPKTTLLCLRKLFRGVLLDESRKGLISWYLPGAGAVSDDTLDIIEDQLVELFGEDALSGNVPYLPDGAILALWPEITAADLQGSISEQEQQLYEMIRIRTLASRMRSAGGQSVVCTMKCGDYTFEVSDQWVEDEGFLAIYGQENRQYQFEGSPLAKVEEGQVIAVASVKREHKNPYQPEAYTFETLFADLADFSITVDEGLVLMLQFMLETGYIYLDANGSLLPLVPCQKVVNVLSRAFPSMQGINLSAYLEQTIQEVVSGRKGLFFAVKQFDQTMGLYGKSLVPLSISSATLSSLQKKRLGRQSSSIIKTPPPAAGSSSLTARIVEAEPQRPNDEEVSLPSPSEEGQEKELVEAVQEIGPDMAPGADAVEPVIEEPQHGEERETVSVEDKADETTEEESLAFQQPITAEEGSASSFPTETGPVEEEPSVFAKQDEEPGPQPAVDEQIVQLPMAAALDEEEKAKSRPCPVCGRPMLLRRDQYGQFFTCTGFPACRYAEPEKGEDQERIPCPVCAKGSVHAKVTPTGKMLYVCSEIDCEFMAWAKPHAVSCPSCGSAFLVEKKLLSGVMELRCPRAGCSFRQPMSSAGDSTAAGQEFASGNRKRKVRIRRVAGGSAAAGGKKKVVRVVRRRK